MASGTRRVDVPRGSQTTAREVIVHYIALLRGPTKIAEIGPWDAGLYVLNEATFNLSRFTVSMKYFPSVQ